MSASASQAETQTAGRVCSYAISSLAETKDTLILVCIGLLEALDRLQERLRLPTSIVKKLKHRLARMVTRSSVRIKTKCLNDQELGDTVAECHLWNGAKPKDVEGVVHWMLAIFTSFQRIVISITLGLCQGIYVLIMSLPGISTTCSLFNGLLQAVEDTLRLSSEEIMEAASAGGSRSESGRSRSNYHLYHQHHRNAVSSKADESLTAVVLEYKEKECMVPTNIDRRIRRVMHFPIPLHAFEATVRLPSGNVHAASSSSCQNRVQEENKTNFAHLSSSSPRSIPVSPMARKRVQLAFSNFSDDVLYRARDRLRQERAATLMGDRSLCVPRFNVHDCHEDIYLSCGRHCASKLGTGMYRSVRGSVPLQKNRFVYFEMTMQRGRTPIRSTNQSITRLETSTQAIFGSSSLFGGAVGVPTNTLNDRGGIDASVCIGLSTRLMPLNTLVGASKHSIGFYSAGHVLVGSERRRSVGVGRKFGFQSTVGVLAQVVGCQDGDIVHSTSGAAPRLSAFTASTGSGELAPSVGEAFVRFTVDGIALRDSNNRVMEFTLPVPSRSELYPTLTLHSQDVHVFSQMSAPDITKLNLQELDLPVEAPVEIWCLDGMPLGVAA